MLLFLFLLLLQCAHSQVLTPSRLRVNYRDPPFSGLQVAVDVSSADFFWEFSSDQGRGLTQSAYRLQLSLSADFSGPLLCDQTVSSARQAAKGCSNLSSTAPFTPLHWRLSTCATGGSCSAFVAGRPFIAAGALPDFAAGYIAAPATAVPPCAPALARLLSPALGGAATSQLTQATAYIASPGYWQLWSSGQRVDRGRAWGGWAEFTQRVHYEVYDLTALYQAPEAAQGGVPLGFKLGPGPYCHSAFAPSYNATAVPLLLEVQLRFANGTLQRLATAGAPPGRPAASPLQALTHTDSVVLSDWYAGETVHADLAAALAGWDSLGFDSSSWAPAEAYAALAGVQLSPALHDPVALLPPIAATAFHSLGGGNYTWAFPQNFAGRVQVTVPDATGFAGSSLLLYAGELMDPDGSVVNQLLVNTTLHWRLAGVPGEVLAPTHFFFGAQYFGVSGWPPGMPPPTLASAVAQPTSTLAADKQALRLAFGGLPFVGGGAPATGAPLPTATAPAAPGQLNASVLMGVQHAILWSQLNNFQALPSDCTNREKRGWMGDGAVSANQLATNYDAAAAMRAWTLSMADDQARITQHYPPSLQGSVSSIVPAANMPVTASDAAWGVAIGEVPYQMLHEYGDTTWAALMYPAARAYYLFLASRTNASTGVMSSVATWGDWDAAFPRTLYQPNTMHIGATASQVRLAQQLLAAAPLVGHPGDAPGYAAFLASVAAPFNALYANASAPWTYVDGVEQTPTLLPLALGLVPPPLLNASTAWLLNDLESTRGLHLSTGATGTRYLFPYLTSIGRTDLAAALAAQSSFPSHGYWVAQGASTCWENWSGATDAQHGMVPPTHNHIFLGSHSGWMWQALVGVGQAPGSTGYTFITVRPPILPGLLPAMAGTLRSVRGLVGAAWAWAAASSSSSLNVTLPANTAAALSVPVAGLAGVTVREQGRVVWSQGAYVPGVPGLSSGALDGPYVTFQASGGGEFAFTAEAAAGGGGGGGGTSSSSSSAAPSGCSGQRLVCRGGARLAAVTQAGFVAAAGGGWSRRFLLTHLLEGWCLGKHECSVPSAGEVALALAPAVGVLAEEAASTVCVEALCA
jgi:hypothetical protein